MPFVVIIPHHPILLQEHLTKVNETTFMVTLPMPQNISEICIALTTPLIQNTLGVGVSFAYPPGIDQQFLGVLTNAKSSDIFSTGWPWSATAKEHQVAYLYLTIEPGTALLEKIAIKPPLDIRLELGKKTALNLFRFLESFQESASQCLIQDPCCALDAWYKRFEEKLAKDRNFVLFTEFLRFFWYPKVASNEAAAIIRLGTFCRTMLPVFFPLFFYQYIRQTDSDKKATELLYLMSGNTNALDFDSPLRPGVSGHWRIQKDLDLIYRTANPGI